ncbi:MAG: 3-oxoacyl-ACP reductase FabG [Clostridia bacterium]|nr:3-oxoacyl-ACP reductase FabG [Clostridia bacterium]
MKNVLITGGSRGIGRKMVYKFAEAGYNVILNYNQSEVSAVEIQREFKNVKAFRADVSNREEVQEMFEFARKKFKDGIDILINNAGVSCTGLLQDVTMEEWNNLMAVNLNGVFYCTQEVLPDMIAKHSGKIINISSIWGMVGAANEVAYSTSKAAIIGMTKALAKEVGPSHINVNCIAPGIVMTDMVSEYTLEEFDAIREQIPLGKIGSTEDVANLALYLASDAGNYITGQVISPNGGWVI